MTPSQPQGWMAQGWRPVHELGLGLSDLGLVQGVMAVDRIRTFGGQITAASMVEQHLERFVASCQQLGIQLPTDAPLASLTHQCAEYNAGMFAGDFSLILLATPGENAASLKPTLCIYPIGIDWSRLSSWYQYGQKLIVSQTQSVPSGCWSPSIKTRARLQYYLADREAAGLLTQAILPDAHGHLTETANANVLLVENGKLVSPPKQSILPGIALARTRSFAERAGIEIVEDKIDVERAKKAEALLLTGTTGCLWGAARLDEQVWEGCMQHPFAQQLLEMWSEFAKLDFVKQATQLAEESSPKGFRS